MASTAVFGVYSDYANVENSVEIFKQSGFRNTDISVLFPQHVGSEHLMHSAGAHVPKNPEKVNSGSELGGAFGWLMGIGALALPGMGIFIAAGPLMDALHKAGMAVGSAVGELTNTMIGLGLPEQQATHYEDRLKRGGILLSVHSDDLAWTRRAKEILEKTGADDISSTTSFNSPNAQIEMPLSYTASDSGDDGDSEELRRLLA